MSDNIELFRTEEISDNLWQEITEGFNITFDTNHSVEHFKKYYVSNVMGYSLHAVKFNEGGELMGYNSFVPSIYSFGEREIKVVNSGGSFVLKQFRKDIFIFHDMFKALLDFSKELGFDLEVGVPNKNSFKYAIKINKSTHLTDLPYYILPINISKILKKDRLKSINIFSKIFISFNTTITSMFSHILNTTETSKPIHIKIDNKLLSSRLSNKDRYHKFTDGCNWGYYRIYDEQGITTAYIMQFGGKKNKKDLRSLSKLVSYILRHEQVDVIMYVGTLNLKQNILLKVPEKFIPQKLHLVYHIIDKSNTKLVETCKDFNNWDFGLINFDAR